MSEYLIGDTTGPREYPAVALAELAGLPVRLLAMPAGDRATAAEVCRDADLLLVTSLRVDRTLLAELPRLKGVVRYGVGLDSIDQVAAAEQGVAVRNVRGFCTEEIADHALGLLLACARGLMADLDLVRRGHWRRGTAPVHRLRGRQLGIVGLGAIGQALAQRAQALGLVVVAHDPLLPSEVADGLGVGLVGLEALLADSDFVSLNCALTDQTHHLLGSEQLALMKPGAFLINTARGGLVDQDALTEALLEGRLAGAGLDVFEPEVPAVDHPLRDLPNVLVTPHVAWYSEEATLDLVVGAFAQVAELVREWLA